MEEYQTQSDEDFVIECGVELQYADLAVAVRRGLAMTSSLPVGRIVASMTPMEYFKCGKFSWGDGWDALDFALHFGQYYLEIAAIILVFGRLKQQTVYLLQFVNLDTRLAKKSCIKVQRH